MIKQQIFKKTIDFRLPEPVYDCIEMQIEG
jgi:hypothetical protein